jgi:transmembrane sensor
VAAGGARITVLGTRFAVHRLPGLVRVSVDHGTVQLAGPPGLDGVAPLLLQASHVGELSEAAGALPRRVQRDARDSFAAVERGLIVFEQAGLAEIAATLSRWRRQPVRAEDAAGADPHITAAVQPRDVEAFIDALPRIAAVRTQERDGATWLAAR